mmetsp:Transcript_43389/g.80811  ORF Transcript_43389/g.80811 Transcript_43389/m.80811 type:complete len:388 (+) Transcript_43389:21-1184(+)
MGRAFPAAPWTRVPTGLVCMGDAADGANSLSSPMDTDSPRTAVNWSVYGPGASTPPEVLALLAEAFGADKIGETGYEIDAAKCCSEDERAQARQRGSSLLYGELLPDGVSKALHPSWLGAALAQNSTVLELGSGSGKVALQTFLQCSGVRKLLGVELVPSRHAIADAALQRLGSSQPDRFQISLQKEGEAVCMEETGGRKIEFRCADFFSVGLDGLCEQCDAIFFAVHIPCRLFAHLCERLAKVKDGCRLFTYHALDSIWWVDEPCPFHQCEVNVPEGDTFSTSWSPQGYKFYVYVCDRSRPPEIQPDPRNESYSEWQAVWDETNQAYYFHNQENETSQWEVPCQAGMWQAVWSEEHSAYYFWHAPTSQSQWEAPKCLADLGWDAGR